MSITCHDGDLRCRCQSPDNHRGQQPDNSRPTNQYLLAARGRSAQNGLHDDAQGFDKQPLIECQLWRAETHIAFVCDIAVSKPASHTMRSRLRAVDAEAHIPSRAVTANWRNA